MGRASLGAALGMVLATSAIAQGISPSLGEPVVPPFRSPILTIEPERVFRESQFGQRIEADLEQASRELAAENRQIEADLIEEERRLTDLRPTLPPGEFAKRAEAFDARVEALRAQQDAKGRALGRGQEAARQQVFQNMLPVLSAILQETGAVAILDREAVFLSFDGIDVTGLAIERIDEALRQEKTARESDSAPAGAEGPPPSEAEGDPRLPGAGALDGGLQAPDPDPGPAPVPDPAR